MKAKILVYALPALILATIHLAEAQQPTKVFRIGFLGGNSPNRCAARHSGRDCASLAMSKGKTLSLSGDIMRENSIASPRSRMS